MGKPLQVSSVCSQCTIVSPELRYVTPEWRPLESQEYVETISGVLRSVCVWTSVRERCTLRKMLCKLTWNPRKTWLCCCRSGMCGCRRWMPLQAAAGYTLVATVASLWMADDGLCCWCCRWGLNNSSAASAGWLPQRGRTNQSVLLLCCFLGGGGRKPVPAAGHGVLKKWADNKL